VDLRFSVWNLRAFTTPCSLSEIAQYFEGGAYMPPTFKSQPRYHLFCSYWLSLAVPFRLGPETSDQIYMWFDHAVSYPYDSEDGIDTFLLNFGVSPYYTHNLDNLFL
jgi:hypothetical protein